MTGEHSGKSVLVVEDDERLRTLICCMLRQSGFLVLEAGDGDEALRIGNGPGISLDLIITDVTVPKQRGPDLARQLRAHHPGVPVIYISGYADSRRELGETDADGEVLAKPFDPEELNSLIDRVLKTGA